MRRRGVGVLSETRGALSRAAGSCFALQAAKVGANLRSDLVAEIPIFLESFADDFFQPRRKIGIEAERAQGRPVQNPVENGGGGIAAEGKRAGCHLVENSAERKEVSARVEVFSLGLFRRHVGGGAYGGTGIGEVVDTLCCGCLYVKRLLGDVGSRREFREAEVEHLGRATFGDEDVGGLDVAMHDAFAMSSIKGISDIDGDAEKALVVHRS